MNLTSIVGKAFKSRQKELLLHQQGAVALQHNVLRNILQQGQNTEYGRRHNLSNVNTYQQFAQSVPLNTYEDLKGDIDRMRQGEKDILWPGTVKWYAKSELNSNQMKEIAYWLEKGFNVSDYAHLTFEEMKDYLYCIDSAYYKNKSFT